jgi:hypothetical protein
MDRRIDQGVKCWASGSGSSMEARIENDEVSALEGDAGALGYSDGVSRYRVACFK